MKEAFFKSSIVACVVWAANLYALAVIFWGYSSQVHFIAALVSSVFVLMVFFQLNRSKPQTIMRILKRVGLLPTPTELSMLVLAVSVLLVLIINNYWGLWLAPVSWVNIQNDPEIVYWIGFVIVLILGLYLSIHHAFSKRSRIDVEEYTMKIFMAVSLMVVAFYSGSHAYLEQLAGYYVLSTWSGLQAFTLFLILRTGELHLIDMPARQAKVTHSMIAILLVVVVVGLGEYVFDLYWAGVITIALSLWVFIESLIVSREVSMQD